MQKIVTFLTYNDRAEAAVQHYLSVFKGSKLVSSSRYPEGGPMPAGLLMVAELELYGQRFLLLNGGPSFTFTEGVSLTVYVDTQAELDDTTEKLIAGGGSQGPCGWVKDRFGMSWQITPTVLPVLMADKDTTKANRVFQAMMKMTKLDIAALQRAHAG
jgi:predicted 3-demethylubiquinone-9 3-methyltransferase (glyoxalase superfamily)